MKITLNADQMNELYFKLKPVEVNGVTLQPGLSVWFEENSWNYDAEDYFYHSWFSPTDYPLSRWWENSGQWKYSR